MSEQPPLSPREQGIKDFNEGKRFNECPFQGFRELDIDRRWHWQKGWLRAQLDEKDRQHPPDFKV